MRIWEPSPIPLSDHGISGGLKYIVKIEARGWNRHTNFPRKHMIPGKTWRKPV